MIDSPEDPLHCSNGPLPASFRVRAYFTANCDEFALGPGDALEYLSWCDQEGLTVLGFDTWEPSQPGPTVVNGGEFEGDASACRERIRLGDFEKLVLNIWVR
jgi:hypothetical protein